MVINQISRGRDPETLRSLLSNVTGSPYHRWTTTARSSCTQPVTNCPSAAASWIENNPWLALGLALAAGALIFGGGK